MPHILINAATGLLDEVVIVHLNKLMDGVWYFLLSRDQHSFYYLVIMRLKKKDVIDVMREYFIFRNEGIFSSLAWDTRWVQLIIRKPTGYEPRRPG
jgi:hypothetical protein